MYEYIFKAMVKEANYLEENGWSQELVSAQSASLCLQHPVSLHKIGSGYL